MAISHAEKVNDVFLKTFYGDMKRFAFAFQTYMLATRLYQLDESDRQARQEKRMVLLDRGAIGDSIFAITAYKDKNLDETEFHTYRSVCNERLPTTLSSQVDMIVILDVDPRVTHERMSKVRKRDAEEGVPLSYLDALDNTQFQLVCTWLSGHVDTIHDTNLGQPPAILVVDWTSFGNTETILDLMVALRKAERKSPQIEFSSHPVSHWIPDESKSSTSPESEKNILVLKSNEDIDRVHQQIIDHTFKEVSFVVINWLLGDLRSGCGGMYHSNSFRRIVMAFLAQTVKIIFYTS